jgi:hypothetical protein
MARNRLYNKDLTYLGRAGRCGFGVAPESGCRAGRSTASVAGEEPHVLRCCRVGKEQAVVSLERASRR